MKKKHWDCIETSQSSEYWCFSFNNLVKKFSTRPLRLPLHMDSQKHDNPQWWRLSVKKKKSLNFKLVLFWLHLVFFLCYLLLTSCVLFTFGLSFLSTSILSTLSRVSRPPTTLKPAPRHTVKPQSQTPEQVQSNLVILNTVRPNKNFLKVSLNFRFRD